VQHQTPNATIRGQNATYTGHGIDTTEAIFADTLEQSDTQIPISVTGTFDVEETAISLNLRKIKALSHLKNGGAFVKSSTTPETLPTRNNPDVYSMLWPTLFPYGVGMFEDPVRLQKGANFAFKFINLKTYVKGYLRLAVRRFQTHLSFQFAMHNIMMLRASSHKSRLAVRRAWWPSAMEAMRKIDEATLATVEKALAAKKAQKDYSRSFQCQLCSSSNESKVRTRYPQVNMAPSLLAYSQSYH
jgi:hypothetical protein